MTKKEELLEFIDLQLDNMTNTLEIDTQIQNTEQPCQMKIGASKPRVRQIITENFSDDLVGHMPNDATMHQIVGWNIIPR